MRESEFEFIRKLVYQRSRICLDAGKREMVSARLGKRLRATNRTSVGDYCQLLQSGEFSKSMQGVTALSLKLQQGSQEAMQKVLTASNLPSRADILELGAQVRGVEERLSRIEAAFHFQSLPPGVDYMIGLWGCVFATLGLGYIMAAVEPRRNVRQL